MSQIYKLISSDLVEIVVEQDIIDSCTYFQSAVTSDNTVVFPDTTSKTLSNILTYIKYSKEDNSFNTMLVDNMDMETFMDTVILADMLGLTELVKICKTRFNKILEHDLEIVKSVFNV